LTSKKKRTQPTDQPANGTEPPVVQETAERAEVLERLLDLAYDVSSYLRHRAQPTIRLSAALLLAASLAACESSPTPTTSSVQPLTREVRTGLPSQPGEYPVSPQSIVRDQRGVYRFQWQQPGGGSPTQAAVSLLKLGQADRSTLVIPQSGDPQLNIPADTQIQLATVTSNNQRNPEYVYWAPFYGGGYYGGGYYGPRYYDPPMQTVPSSGPVTGSTSSVSPPAPAARTSGVSHAVSGQAGGAGSGSAASNKAGVSSVSGGKSGAVAPSASSSFSAGKGASSAGGGKSGGGGGGSSSS